MFSFLAITAAVREELVVTPREIRKRPWEPFSFHCRAEYGFRPDFVFADTFQSLSNDQRFTISRTQENEITVNAPFGLRGTEPFTVL